MALKQKKSTQRERVKRGRQAGQHRVGVVGDMSGCEPAETRIRRRWTQGRANQQVLGHVEERYCHWSEIGAPAKLSILHPAQGAANGNSASPVQGTHSTQKKELSSICSEDPQSHHANRAHTTGLESDALLGDQMSQKNPACTSRKLQEPQAVC